MMFSIQSPSLVLRSTKQDRVQCSKVMVLKHPLRKRCGDANKLYVNTKKFKIYFAKLNLPGYHKSGRLVWKTSKQTSYENKSKATPWITSTPSPSPGVVEWWWNLEMPLKINKHIILIEKLTRATSVQIGVLLVWDSDQSWWRIQQHSNTWFACNAKAAWLKVQPHVT